MNKIIPVFLTFSLSIGAGAANKTADKEATDIVGTWSGKLNVTAQNSLRLVFHMAPDSVTIDSPDQNAFGIEGKMLFLSTDSVSLAVPRLNMDYNGKLVSDSIVGQFRQGVFTMPLVLYPGVKKANRPQTPCPPFRYMTESVTVETPDAVLAGTLTIPENATRATPVVVLVSGSGLQNRDEEIFEHKPFAVIADYLARNGIASLRYDDRGYGESKGSFENATTADFANDAKGVADYLRSSGRFSKVGIIGHSEGGMIGYMLGGQPGTVDFIISIAGPAVSGAEINAYQNKVALVNTGVDSLSAAQFATALLKANQYRLANPPLKVVSDELLGEIYPEYKDSPLAQKLSETISATLSMERIQPWMEYFLKSDPAADLRKLRVPSLIIYGEKDCQVPAALNAVPAGEAAPDAQVRVYPGLNHMMQHAATGSVEEYKEIEETFSEEVLSDIVTFIRSIL